MRLGYICAIVTAALTLAGPAAAAQPSPGVPAVDGASEQDFDLQGRPLGPPRAVDPATHRASRADRSAADSRTLQSHGSSGCKQVDAWRNSYSLLGKLVYRWHQVKYWCWNAAHTVYNVRISAYPTDVDPNWYWRGTYGSGWYFTWYGNGQGGHYSIRQAKMENCVFSYGCIGSEFPWVKIWAYGNGGWSYETGK